MKSKLPAFLLLALLLTFSNAANEETGQNKVDLIKSYMQSTHPEFDYDHWTFDAFMNIPLAPIEVQNIAKSSKLASFVGMFVSDKGCSKQIVSVINDMTRLKTGNTYQDVLAQTCVLEKSCIDKIFEAVLKKVSENQKQQEFNIKVLDIDMPATVLVEALPLSVEYICSAIHSKAFS